MKKIGICRISVFLIIIYSLAFCGNLQASGNYYLELSSIGLPTADKETTARNILDLFMKDGRLYMGHGDASVNTGPTDVIYYDMASGKFVTEFTVDDEAIRKYEMVDNKFVIPGVDATEDWDFGNLYVQTDTSWEKLRTIPNGLHVFDIASYGGKWFASAGTYFTLGDEMFPAGGIFASENQGKTWKFVYSTPTYDNSVFRINSIIPYKDKLYCFIYAYAGMKTDSVPQAYRKYLGKAHEGENLILMPNLFGSLDCVTFDGKQWGYVDIIAAKDICMVSPFVYHDKLFMSALSGQYVDYFNLSDGLPANAEMGLYAYDGVKTERVNIDFEMIRDYLVKDGKLLLLILKDGAYHIAETEDLISWKHYYLPGSIKPVSIEYDDKSFYIGTRDGNIFRSTGIKGIDDPSSSVKKTPIKIYAGGEIPRDGNASWAAITNWKKWGKPASLICEIKDGKTIDVKTDNVSSFEIFLPLQDVDDSPDFTLIIDGKKEFDGKFKDKTSLNCEFTRWGNWKVKREEGTMKSFECSPMFVGKSDVDLPIDGDDPALGLWLSDVLCWSASTEVSLIQKGKLRKALKKGEISLEDLFDLTYKTTICTFKATGDDIKKMLEYNIKLPESYKFCQVSGFALEYEVKEKPEDNTITACSLDPQKEYTVSAPLYLLKDAKSLLGTEIKYEITGKLLTDAMIEWFEEFRSIEKTEPRIKITKKAEK